MKSRLFLSVQLLIVLSGCGTTDETTTPPPGTTSPTTPASSSATPSKTDSLPPWVRYSVGDLPQDTVLFAQPRQVGAPSDESLTEASGLAPSQRNPGYLWTEEDSGNPNQIQLLKPDGSILARFTIDGAENRDWEDIAVGPGPVAGETYIYLADIGDNKLRYPEKVIYRFPEPGISGQALPYSGHVANAEAIRLTLPDGPKNAEAILIDPVTKDLFIFSKEDRSEIYQATFPQSVTKAAAMTRLLLMPFDKVTSATISATGAEILVRTYNRLFYYKRQSGETVVDALKRAPRLLPLADEPQGEAVSWALDGSGYYTTSEKTFMTSQVIYFYRRN